MKLEVGYINITGVQFGAKTEIKNGLLTVERNEFFPLM